jgi:hypothetical protein
MKFIRYFALIMLTFCFERTTFGQTLTDCFEIKHLDFFGIEPMDTFKYAQKELDALLLFDFTKRPENNPAKTNFLIPYIIFQLKRYHPSCATETDTSTYRKLKQLYFRIRNEDMSVIEGKPISKQLKYIRRDYYKQLQNDSLLPFMNYSVDHGPFYGLIPNKKPKYNRGTAYKTEFGKLIITKDIDRVFITVINKQNKHLWSRVLTVNSNRLLTDIQFYEERIVKSSLGYVIQMFSENEALNLYLKPNGGFRFYFHSW